MSRIGRLPIHLDKSVKASIAGATLKVEGPKGKLERKLVANMVEGVGKGFTRVLEINGVGYRAEAKGTQVNLTLGFSHPIVYQLPPGVTAKVEKLVTVTLESADRQLLGTVAAQIRELRPPEPYKGKGIKYATETIRRKAGKAAAGSTAA